MTKELEMVFERVKLLPPERQEAAVNLLEDFLADDIDGEELSAQEWDLIKVGLDQAERGEFATEEEVRKAFDSFRKRPFATLLRLSQILL